MVNRNKIISIDDYNPNNLRIANLIKQAGLESNTVFFIDFRDKERAAEQIGQLYLKGFKIGGHTMNHPQDLKQLTIEQARIEIENCREWIQKITGEFPEWFCYPRGRFNEQIKRLVKEAGYKYARTTMVLNASSPKDDYEIDTTIHCFERKEYNGQDWLDIARQFINSDTYLLSTATIWPPYQMFHFWGHTSELMRPGELEKFEQLLELIKKI